MPFGFERTSLDGLIVIKPKVFGDERGFFIEAFVKRDFESVGIRMDVLQIMDVTVDIRPNSPTFGRHYSINLSEANKLMLNVPRGFAHGFLSLADNVEVEYAVDNHYSPAHEGGIIWNDPDIAINWPIANPVVSEKDKKWPTLRQLKEQLKSA